MSEQSWWQRTFAAVNREYERRIRRASLVTEYGAVHHDDHSHDDHGTPTEPEADEAEVAEIVNVPKGTLVGRHTRPASTPPSEPPA
jgi:hypothetical protein